MLVAPRRHPVLEPELEATGCILKRIHNVEELRTALWFTPRWGLPEWHGASSKEELAALVGRSLRRESFDAFLRVDSLQGSAQPMTIWQRLDLTEKNFQAAERLAIERLHELTQLRDRVTFAEAELARTASRAQAYLSALDEARNHAAVLTNELHTAKTARLQAEYEKEAERQRAVLAEAELAKMCSQRLAYLAALGEARDREAKLEERLRIAEAELESIRTSTIWRLSKPLRTFANRRPSFRRLIRRTRTTVGTVLRRSQHWFSGFRETIR